MMVILGAPGTSDGASLGDPIAPSSKAIDHERRAATGACRRAGRPLQGARDGAAASRLAMTRWLNL